jgi:hypothetical protein
MATRNESPRFLDSKLQALDALSRAQLQQRWQEVFAAPCPPRMSRSFLLRAVAYRVQEQALGGLDRATRRRLERAAVDLAAGRPVAPPTPKIKPGTRLLREWQSVTHEVTVLEKGVQYRDQTWPSLSAVVREITGARWSGPRFFGLKETRRGSA